MSYDTRLMERTREALHRRPGWTEKDFHGGRVCVLRGRPFLGVVPAGLVVRCDEDARAKFLALNHCSTFAPDGRALPGWVTVNREALKTVKQLSRWVEVAWAHAEAATPQPAPKRAKAANTAARPRRKRE
jgi:hypothetical protein